MNIITQYTLYHPVRFRVRVCCHMYCHRILRRRKILREPNALSVFLLQMVIQTFSDEETRYSPDLYEVVLMLEDGEKKMVGANYSSAYYTD